MTANAAAVALFGIAGKNIANFTMDAFLLRRSVSNFERRPAFLGSAVANARFMDWWRNQQLKWGSNWPDH